MVPFARPEQAVAGPAGATARHVRGQGARSGSERGGGSAFAEVPFIVPAFVPAAPSFARNACKNWGTEDNWRKSLLRRQCLENALPSRARSARRFQFVQERLGVFQVGGIEPFGEPVVDLREKIVRFAAPVLIAPEPGKVGRGAKFESECALPLGRLDRLQQPRLGLGDLFAASSREANARQAMRFGLEQAIAAGRDESRASWTTCCARSSSPAFRSASANTRSS